MTKIVQYDTLLSEVADIQPTIAWLLSNVPPRLKNPDVSKFITSLLEDLQLKHAKLQGKILELEANVIELEDGAVAVNVPDDVEDGAAYIENALRDALAEIIIQRGEERLEAEAHHAWKNMMFAYLYGGGPVARKWRETYLGTQESIETWTPQPPNRDACPILPGGSTLDWLYIKEAIAQAVDQYEEEEAFQVAKAVVTELATDTPDIDLDGQLLD
jgi:hypothetical protein